MRNMKTIKEWLEELPEPYRTQAIENHQNKKCNFDLRFGLEETEPTSLKDCLLDAFSWADTKQGGKYWQSLYEGLYD